MEPDEKTIGELIEQRRLGASLSKSSLARKLGTSYQRVILWEADKHAPSPAYAERLARELGGDAADYLPVPYQPLGLRAEVDGLRASVEATSAASALNAESLLALTDSLEALHERVAALEEAANDRRQSQPG